MVTVTGEGDNPNISMYIMYVSSVASSAINQPSVTPLKTNISPEKLWLDDVFSIEIVPF